MTDLQLTDLQPDAPRSGEARAHIDAAELLVALQVQAAKMREIQDRINRMADALDSATAPKPSPPAKGARPAVGAP